MKARQDMKIGFDNDKYLKLQSEHIKERIVSFGDKLYLEFSKHPSMTSGWLMLPESCPVLLQTRNSRC